MGSIDVKELAYAHPGGAELFEDVSFKIGNGDHTAIVGANGVGKTTLLRLIAGEISPLKGSVRVDGRLGVMPQSIGSLGGELTVHHLLAECSPPEVRAASLELEAASEANEANPSDETGIRLGEAYGQWGDVDGYTHEAFWDDCCTRVLRQPYPTASRRLVRELSGGEQKRLALEVLLASNADVLLLDEPDNFLDIKGKRWMEAQLNSSNKTILMVSHDRELLVHAARKIVTIEADGAWVHGGSFAKYHEAHEARNERLGNALERWQQEERRLFQHYRWMKQIAGSGGSSSKANAAETQWKKFVDAGPPPAPPKKQNVRIRFDAAESGRGVLNVKALELVGLTETFDFEARLGERVAVLGPNGAGKSHFLRLLAGDDNVLADGVYAFGQGVVVGYFSQTSEKPEFQGREIVEIVMDHGLNHQHAMAALARYELAYSATQEFQTLSGGQKARVQILLLELNGANLLLLDEPTDNLDLASAEALQTALDEFDGTVLAVTHDRWFMKHFDRFLVFDYSGDVDEPRDFADALQRVTTKR